MNKRRVIEHARQYLEQLSRGVDPISGEAAESVSIAPEGRLSKCFGFVAELLGELLENGGCVALPGEEAQYELVRKKAAFRLSEAQRQQVFVTQGPITPVVFVRNINRVAENAGMEKLSSTRINAWLTKQGYFSRTTQPVTFNRTVIKPMPQALAIGIQEAEVTDPKTGEIKTRILLTNQAQRFLLDNLDRIIEET